MAQSDIITNKKLIRPARKRMDYSAEIRRELEQQFEAQRQSLAKRGLMDLYELGEALWDLGVSTSLT